MTTVWQSLLPETPSTEPLTLSQQPADPPLSSVTSMSNNYYHNHSPESFQQPPKPACDNNNFVSHTTQYENDNNAETSAMSDSGGSSRKRAFQRFTSSVNCGDQFWKFYNDRFDRRHSGESSEFERRRRCFLKSGIYNSRQVNAIERTRRYIRDVFTTLVDSRWRWTLLVFSVSYILSWLGFAIIWFIIFLSHGDIENADDPNWQPCVVGVRSFASVFLFSLETQHTIGYGTRYMNDNCVDAILTLIVQSITGILIEAFMVGVVFAKLSRPKKRSQTLVFSKNAVVSQRDGKLYLMIRVGDLRNRSSIFEAHIRAQIITKRATAEGEIIPLHQQEIKIGGYEEDEDRILLFWPTILCHPIDQSSPFYSMSSSDMLKSKFELLVILEGVVESTGMTTQLRTSYLPQEILWGRRFRDLSSYKLDSGIHVFDFELFNSTFPVDTPQCSAKDLDHIPQLKSTDLGGHTGIIMDEFNGGRMEIPSVIINDQSHHHHQRRHQKRNHAEIAIEGGPRRASVESSDDFDGNRFSGSSSDADSSDEDSDGRKISRLGLPSGERKRQRSSTCTCSTNVSDSNV